MQSSTFYQPTQTMHDQVCRAPKLRNKSLHAPAPRKRIQVVVPSTQPFFLEPREYTYPKPTHELKESKTEVLEIPVDTLGLEEKTYNDDSSYCCVGCNQVLGGQVLTTATNKFWHSKCFKCRTCHIDLEHFEYYEQDGMPYCAFDFHEQFSPRCDYCKTPIEADRKIVALGKSYHVGHAFCRECGIPFNEEDRIIEKDGFGYCEQDYNKLFAKTCKGCGEYISQGGFIKALGGQWHTSCFVCVDCGSQFTSLTFKLKGGKPHCGCQPKKETVTKKEITTNTETTAMKETDTRKETTTSKNDEKICHNCQKPILGRCNSAFGFDYHPIHFQCSQCEKVLSARLTGLFERDSNGEIICKNCVDKN